MKRSDLKKQFPFGEGGYGDTVSLNKAMGKKIRDIEGYFSDPYGGGLTFGVSRIHFDDGSTTWVEGSHDWAYIYEGFPFDLDEVEDDEDE